MTDKKPFDIVINGTRETIELRIIVDGHPTASLAMSISGARALAEDLHRAANAAAGLAKPARTQGDGE